MKIKLTILCAAASLSLSCAKQRPENLRVDYIRVPELTEINSQTPMFSWQVGSKSNEQAAYQIVVSQDGESVWNSGKVNSNNCAAVPYDGAALDSGSEYQWRVRYWDDEGKVSRSSKLQHFKVADDSERSKSIVTDNPLMRRIDEASASQQVDDMCYLYDFEKSAFGRISFEMNAKRDGVITLHIGEQLTADGRVERAPGGTIRYTKVSVIIKKGITKYDVELPVDKRNTGKMAVPVPEEWGGVITPFRYVEVAGVRESEAKSLKLYRDVMYGYRESLGAFDSSNELLNQIWDICRYTIESTDFLGYYIDGDRERIPYEADAYINQLSHYCVDSEYAIGKKSLEYFMTHATWPTEWLLHTIMIAYQDYLYTGDTRLIKQYYTKLKAKTLYELAREDGLINAELATPRYLLSIGFKADALRMRDIVDWPPAAFTKGGDMTEVGERDGHEMKPINTVVNAFHYHALNVMSDMAAIIGKEEDSEFFAARANKVRETINTKLFDKERGIYIDGEGSTHASLHSNMMPLAFGVVDEENVKGVVEYVKSRGMACSVYGAQYLFEALYNAGESDYALELLTNTSDRSWYNMIELGSTMTLEAWDLKYKRNLDWNHAWGTAPANIIPRYMWGVQPTDIGYKSAIIKPQLSTLDHSSIAVPTLQGIIRGEYVKEENNKIYTIDVPSNMIATFRVVDPSRSVTLNGAAVETKEFELTRGENTIVVQL